LGINQNQAIGLTTQTLDHSRAILQGISIADLAVEAVVRPTTGPINGIGLIARVQANGNAYFGGIGRSPDGLNYWIQIWKNVNNVWTRITANNSRYFTPSEIFNQTIRFEVLGSSLKVYINNEIEAFAIDSSITTAGGVGIHLGTSSRFDDFLAVARPPITPSIPGYQTNFPSSPQGSLTPEWQERSGFFRVAENQATGGSQVQPNIATLNGVSLWNGTIDGTFFFTQVNQAAGVIARYSGFAGTGTGDANYYTAMINPLTNGTALVRLLKNINGNWTELRRQVISGNFLNTTTTLRFSLTGKDLSVSVNNQFVFYTVDSTWAVGSVGFRVGNTGSALASIRNFQVF
jgi:hypothetical protein